MYLPGRKTCWVLTALLGVSLAAAQTGLSNLVTTGQVTVAGRTVPYTIRHLPPASFPDLPWTVAEELTRRGCLIPQTYEAHRPENVIEGSFEQPDSSDWAVLCSVDGTATLLVFFASAPQSPMALASAPETQRLQQLNSTGELGFDWGIDPATPNAIHDLQDSMWPRPGRLDHDALADSIVDQKTIYRYYAGGKWSVVQTPD